MVLECLEVFLGGGFLVIAIAAISCIIYARWNYGTLEKMGIPMDKPHFFLGSAKDSFTVSCAQIDIDNFKRFGPVFGVYEGRQPQVYICDADLIRLIAAKDAEYFNDKRHLDLRNSLLNEMLDFQPYGKWKLIRSEMTTALTISKIKNMSSAMTSVIEKFKQRLEESVSTSPSKSLEKYDLRDEIYVMLTEMICNCCFNIQIDNPTDKDNLFVKIVRELIQPENIVSYPMLENLSLSFPILNKIIPTVYSPKLTDKFVKIFKELMEARRQGGQKLKDVVDFCIEWIDKLDTPEFKANGVTEKTVITQAFVFFIGGQEQISTTVAVIIYNLLKNPEALARAQVEVDSFFDRHKGQVKIENISELTYLTGCINEALRLSPFFSRAERVCTKDWKNEEFNLEIKKGTVAMFPLWAIGRNPKYFEDPEKFSPDRFLPGNKEKLHPYAFGGFGWGPRNCIAIKFSYDVMLLISVFLIKKFDFHLRKDSEPQYIPAGNFFVAHLPFYFDVTLRK